MKLELYNTLSKQKEEFKPIDDKAVRIYSCGPTVYYYAHVGNLRSYLFMDNLRRVLKYNGYNLFSLTSDFWGFAAILTWLKLISKDLCSSGF